MSPDSWWLIALEGLVVIGFIALGVRSGGVGLGLWGGVGTLVLVFGFGLDPGEPPIDAMLIIIAVISAAAAMEAAGGIDYMVLIASRALRARPKALNIVAPFVSYLLAILTGTSNTFYSIVPVINEVAYSSRIRPERALSASTVASALGITSSPVAAAMATMLPLVEVEGYDLVDVLLITIPASIVGILVMSIVMSRHGKELDDDEEFQRRLDGGRGPAARPARRHRRAAVRQAQRRDLPRRRARHLPVRLRRGPSAAVPAEGGGEEPMSVTPIIQMVMLAAAALIMCPREGRRGHDPEHADLPLGHGGDDRPVRHRVDGRHLHRQQRGGDRRRARQTSPRTSRSRSRSPSSPSRRSRRASPQSTRTMVPLGPDARHRRAAT